MRHSMGLGAVLALAVACADDAPITPGLAPAPDELRDDVGPAVRILRPGPEDDGRIAYVPTGLQVVWEDVEGTDPVVGYQVKLIAILDPLVPEETIVRTLTHGTAGEWSPYRRPNLLIPEELRVDEPDEAGLPAPPTPTSGHYYETAWWPHASAPLTTPSLRLDDLPPLAYVFALRAIDADGRVTPPERFGLAGDEPGNVLVLQVRLSTAEAPRLWVGLDDDRHLVDPPSEVFSLTWAQCVPFEVSWGSDATWYGYEEGPSRHRLDCIPCEPGPGVNEWSPWGDTRDVSVALPSSAVGEDVRFRIEARDERDLPEHETRLELRLDVIDFPVNGRTALVVDDFVAPDVDDGDHDAFLDDLIGYAVAPYLEPGEEIDRLDTRPSIGGVEGGDSADPALALLARYETVFWAVSANAAGSTMGRATDPSPLSPHGRTLEQYVHWGGNLVVWGRETIGAMLGDYYPSSSWDPDIPGAINPNFGPGTFVWDQLRLRVRLDRTGRGPLVLELACSGIVGFEATDLARTLGLPVGISDPSGYDPSREAIWVEGWSGHHHPAGRMAVAPVGIPPLDEPLVEPLYTVIPSAWAWSDELETACGSTYGSPFDGEPILVRVHPTDGGGKIVWIGTELHPFTGDGGDAVRALMRGITDWIHED